MTNRDLLSKALPLVTLSEKEWDTLSAFISEYSDNQEVLKILNTLQTNQARLEVMADHNDYYFSDDHVRGKSTLIML